MDRRSWKSREKELRMQGRIGTVMKAHINKTSQPSSFTPRVRKHQPQIRMLRTPLFEERNVPRFARDDGFPSRNSLSRHHEGNRPDSDDAKEEDFPSEILVSHALAEQAFAAGQFLFSDFPIPRKGVVSHGIDYFLGVCAPPSLGQRPEWDWRRDSQSEYTVWYIQNILRSDVLFELVVAYAVALRIYVHKDLEGHETKYAIAFHTQNALRRLRRRLQNKDAYQDDVNVWSVVMLCGTTLILQELDAFQAHVQGLRQMVALRGGIESLDKFGYFKKRIIKYGLYV
ncbi:hypothetical protein H2200_003519 [Cladophialophora chaetospira]|uniref:Uncharacterized protein n=1 Tax=Cladophialophora chaetospira TaxID=386627 RepID=A0AA38XHL2_9EURO|nr:hypothetical protein H2200_003519 [Cladophialophora chaetospira]